MWAGHVVTVTMATFTVQDLAPNSTLLADSSSLLRSAHDCDECPQRVMSKFNEFQHDLG